MEEPALSETDERTLRFLRRLVLVLTTVMIVGMAVLVVLFVTRFPGSSPKAPMLSLTLPDSITLPEGARALAITQGQGWWAVVTDSDQILIFDAATGALRQTVQVGG